MSTGTPLLSFHNDPAVKAKYLARVRAHQAADNLIRGTGWSPQLRKGCAVGCTLEAYDHNRYPIELGLPVWLARLEDALFEGMSEEKSRTWPEDFLAAIPEGVSEQDFETKVKALFLIAVLKSVLAAFDHSQFPDVKAAVEGSIAIWERCDIGSVEWESAARSAAWAAESAAYAARSAASAAYAAWAAAYAAWAAAYAAWAAESAASAAWSAARSAKYDQLADQLLALFGTLESK